MDETDTQFEKLFEKLDKVLNILTILDKYVDIDFQLTQQGKPIMFVKSLTLNQSWLIHISKEDYETATEVMGLLKEKGKSDERR